MWKRSVSSHTARQRKPSLAATAVWTAALVLGAGFLSISEAQVRGRWLEVRRTSGNVAYLRSGSRAARMGDRLESPGHGVNTGRSASAVLAIDNGIGTVTVAQNTRLSIARLDVLSNGASVTILNVPRGQARIRARTLTNPNSRLELHTPSGVAAVRGTEFGVSVSNTGKTSIGTLEGAVAASAQGELVEVEGGFASVIPPGQPPTPPRPLDRELVFELILLDDQGETVFIEGQVNPANTVFIGEQETPVSLAGTVRTTVSLGNADSIMLTVQNPLGESQDYRLAVR
ncbi:MAG: FecR domain-containing protein [Cyanobacteria bacterium P01_H01_bin.119]